MCRGVKCRMIDAHPHAGRKEFAASINKAAIDLYNKNLNNKEHGNN